MNPAAPQTGLALPAPASAATPISPSGAPGLPPLPQGTTPPALGVQQPQAFDTAGTMNAIANYYQIPKATALAQAGVKQNEFNATTAFQGQTELTSKEAQLRLDESAYKKIPGPNGVQILDPVSGQPVDIGTYVNRTGANPADILKNSPNPRDQQFVQDYSNFQNFLNAAQNKNVSKEAALAYQSFVDQNPGLEGLSPQQAANLFLGEYGNYFGLPQQGQSPTTPQFTPQYTPNLLNYMLSRTTYSANPPSNIGPDYLNILNQLPGGSGQTTPTTSDLNTLRQQIQQAANTSP